MIAVIFEVEPAPGQRDAYLAKATDLKPMLETVDGFISVERFYSLNDANKILSLSFWRDEVAVAKWRQLPEHRAAQCMGRHGGFAKYRLRIAGVVRDYGLHEREEAPTDSKAVHG
jgi:heme-degrading monooxygenase HmoA